MKTYELITEKRDAEFGWNYCGVVLEISEDDVRHVVDVIVSDDENEIRDLASHWLEKK